MQNIDITAFRRILQNAVDSKVWSARSLSSAAGLGPDAVRDIMSGKNANPSAKALVGLLNALKIDLREIIVGQDTVSPIAARGDGESLTVKASVAAGVWREHIEWPVDEWYNIEVAPLGLRGVERFAVRMDGYSMDKTIPPGSDLDCIRVQFGRMEPAVGDLVIVERQAHDLTELTCKRLDIIDGNWALRAESTKPEFSDPIMLGKADKDLATDDEIRVVGIVVSSQQRLFRRR